MTTLVSAVGAPMLLEPQQRTGFEVLIDCGAAVMLQFATPAQAIVSWTCISDRMSPPYNGLD